MIEEKGIFLNATVLISILTIVVIGVGAFLLLSVSGMPLLGGNENLIDADSNSIDLEIAPVVGAIPPDFSLVNLNGDEVNLRSFRGQPVLINFWATWCAPCRAEMPAIQSRFDRPGAAGPIPGRGRGCGQRRRGFYRR